MFSWVEMVEMVRLLSGMVTTRLLVLLAVTALCTANDDFNCQETCGTYASADKSMPTVLDQCSAYDKSKCPAANLAKAAAKAKTQKGADTRIVGGEEVTYPLSWMVMLTVHQEMCGGSLINSRFVLTAAHCTCAASDLCTRSIGTVEAGKPLEIKDVKDAISKTDIMIGMTERKAGNKAWLFNEAIQQKTTGSKHLFYKPDMMILHPLLGTSEEYKLTPDILLIRLSKAVPSFNDNIRPVCLAKPETVDYPPCPDISVDKKTKTENKKGGCGIIAGWGARRSAEVDGSECFTDVADEYPAKSKACSKDSWTVNGQVTVGCSMESPKVDELSSDCSGFIKEIEFQNKYKDKASQKWKNGDYKTITQGAPVEIIKVKKKGNKTITCSRIDMQAVAVEKNRENSWFNGWCATEIKKKKIDEMGLCVKKEKCDDQGATINYATVNLLTVEECVYLFNVSKAMGGPDFMDMMFKKDLEMCGGKKKFFPKERQQYIKVKKSAAEKKADEALFLEVAKGKEKQVAKEMKPSKYKYVFQGKHEGLVGVPKDYAYNWYIGGIDTCQGDSGGPMWKHEGTGAKLRATQVGVVARGQGCAGFNAPGIYTRVSQIYKWLQETVTKNAAGANLCPPAKKRF